ncbi:cytochrome P450 [Mycena albidolilacea]|uniref:Cytochrome P450 n=1 Tax=Mycena albidolilacea TaxID=1033008 RepID=A0AAD7AME8_9AGAR|nr:cytochrome P450 [Mycena albidolilacea]
MNVTQASSMELAIYAITFATLISATVRLLFRHRSTIRQILGPPSPSWIFGHMLQLRLSREYGDHEFQWLKQFGSVYRLQGCFGKNQLMVADPLALQYILNSPVFGRTGAVNVMVDLVFGKKSVIGAQDNEHRRLRAGLNIGFTATAVRNYQPVFERVAETIAEELDNHPAASINISPLLTVATLGAITEAVFRYSLKDLGEEFVENNFQTVELTATRSEAQLLVDALSDRLPLWLWHAATYLPTTAFKIIRRGNELADQMGRQIVRERLDAAKQGLKMNDDLFSILLDPDVQDHMSGDDVVAQIRLILLAGQETTANTIAWGLLELAKNPAFQEKLRAEIQDALGTSAGAVAYDGMPLLNAFIKETIRLYPALPLADRVVLQDTTIPLSDPITTSTGHINRIPVLKGQHVTLCIAAYQRLESRWGADSHDFNPFRWLDGTEFRKEAVGPYANLLSFLGGPRTCLGWRFAIVEMQVILSHLVAKFSFAQVEGESILPRYLNNLLPVVSSGEKAVPLSITRI